MDYTGMMIYVGVSMVTPGPNNLMVLYLFAKGGFKGARKFIVGASAGLLLKLLLCGALNFALAAAVPAAVPYLKWVGAAYMVYLAVHMVADGLRAAEDTNGEAKQAESSGESTYQSGFLLQTFNIKTWIMALSAFSIYVVPYGLSPLPIAICVGYALLVYFLGCAAWGFFGSAFKRAYENHKKAFSLLMGASLVWCAVTALI